MPPAFTFALTLMVISLGWGAPLSGRVQSLTRTPPAFTFALTFMIRLLECFLPGNACLRWAETSRPVRRRRPSHSPWLSWLVSFGWGAPL